MATQPWSYQPASNIEIAPYTSHSFCRSYENVAIYAEVKQVPLAIKLTTSHIFISYVPLEMKDLIKQLIHEGTNLKQFDTYYFEELLNIPRTQPYKNLASMNMENRERFSISLSKKGYQYLTNPDIFYLLFSLWHHFYHPNNSYKIKNTTNQFGIDAFLQNTKFKDVVLFDNRYDMKEMEYLFIYEYLINIGYQT